MDTTTAGLEVGERSSWLGGIFSSFFGIAAIYMGFLAFDPAFMASGPSVLKLLFRLVESFSPPVRGSIIIGVGALVLAVGGVLLYSSIWPDRRLKIDGQGAETFGDGGGRLAWSEIGSVSQVGKLLVITSADRAKTLSIDTGDINTSIKRIKEAIGRFRPDLVEAVAPRPKTS